MRSTGIPAAFRGRTLGRLGGAWGALQAQRSSAASTLSRYGRSPTIRGRGSAPSAPPVGAHQRRVRETRPAAGGEHVEVSARVLAHHSGLLGVAGEGSGGPQPCDHVRAPLDGLTGVHHCTRLGAFPSCSRCVTGSLARSRSARRPRRSVTVRRVRSCGGQPSNRGDVTARPAPRPAAGLRAGTPGTSRGMSTSLWATAAGAAQRDLPRVLAPGLRITRPGGAAVGSPMRSRTFVEDVSARLAGAVDRPGATRGPARRGHLVACARTACVARRRRACAATPARVRSPQHAAFALRLAAPAAFAGFMKGRWTGLVALGLARTCRLACRLWVQRAGPAQGRDPTASPTASARGSPGPTVRGCAARQRTDGTARRPGRRAAPKTTSDAAAAPPADPRGQLVVPVRRGVCAHTTSSGRPSSATCPAPRPDRAAWSRARREQLDGGAGGPGRDSTSPAAVPPGRPRRLAAPCSAELTCARRRGRAQQATVSSARARGSARGCSSARRAHPPGVSPVARLVEHEHRIRPRRVARSKDVQVSTSASGRRGPARSGRVVGGQARISISSGVERHGHGPSSFVAARRAAPVGGVVAFSVPCGSVHAARCRSVRPMLPPAPTFAPVPSAVPPSDGPPTGGRRRPVRRTYPTPTRSSDSHAWRPSEHSPGGPR